MARSVRPGQEREPAGRDRDHGCPPLDAAPAARIDRYIRRMEQGNLGDSKAIGQGVRELRIDFGPGYRVYYAIEEARIILLLGGGTKRNQSQDIKKAIHRWSAYKSGKKQR